MKPLRTQGKYIQNKTQAQAPTQEAAPNSGALQKQNQLETLARLRARIPPDCQGHRKQGKTEKLSQPRIVQGDKTMKFSVVPRMRSLNKKINGRKPGEI